MGGVAGVEPGRVLVLGGGVVGTCAAKVAAGMGADVVITDPHLERLRYLDDVIPRKVTTIFSDPHAVRRYPNGPIWSSGPSCSRAPRRRTSSARTP